MITEAFAYFQDLVQRAMGEEIVHPPFEPHHVYYLRDRSAGGALVRMEAPPPARKYSATTVEAFVAVVKEFVAPAKAAVFCDCGMCQALFDESSRREDVSVALDKTDPFKALSETPGNRTQSDFIWFLQSRLGVSQSTIAVFRNLRITGTQDGKCEISQGREAISKAVKREVYGADSSPIPTNLAVTLNVYRGFEFNRDIPCHILFNPSDMRFMLRPAPEAMYAAKRDTQMAIFQYVATELADYKVVAADSRCVDIDEED